MTDTYLTVSGDSCVESVINKSRFIGYASPCSDEDAALLFLQNIRNQHKSATHHCYAYVIGENSGIMRYSDDGEPGGTAGMPIMSVIRSVGIVNCCIVVVRYFGGVLLGTGGLVRAYTQSAQAALKSAGIAEMTLTTDELFRLPYSCWDKFRYACEHLPVMITGIEYGSDISFHLCYRSAEKEIILPRVLEASDRKLTSVSASEAYMPWKTE